MNITGALRGALIAAAAAIMMIGSVQRAQAMPPFAQANAVDCSACHTMVPALNSYGRYIQRTAYGGLDYHLLQGHSPFWINERIRGKSTGAGVKYNPDAKWSYGNVQVDALGAMSSAWTYRVEQTLYSNNIGGGNTGMIWVSYNKLLDSKLHLMVGKVEPSVPGPFTGWQDITGVGGAAGITVGKHKYNLTGSRWGTRWAYVEPNYTVELNYGVGSHSMLTAGDFDVAPGTDKVFGYMVSFGNAGKPFEYGIYGASGGYVVSNKITDKYSATAVYAQRDPYEGWPGFFAYYQLASDNNPGVKPYLPVTSRSYAFEIYKPFLHDQIMFGIRPLEISQSGANGATIKHFGNIDFASRIPHLPYLFFYAESAFGGSSNAPYGRPTWQWGLRWAGPIEGPINRIY